MIENLAVCRDANMRCTITDETPPPCSDDVYIVGKQGNKQKTGN